MPTSILYILPPTRTFAGIERVVDSISSGLSCENYSNIEVSVLHTSFYANHNIGNVPYKSIQINVSNLTRLFFRIRKIISSAEFDLVVVPQIEPTVICWLACMGLRQKFALYLHGNPKLEIRNRKSQLLFYIFKIAIATRLAGVMGTAPSQLASFADMLASTVPTFWTPNPVREFDVAGSVNEDSSEFVTYVNVSRYCHQKGQDILIRCFAEVYAVRKHARLKLVGFGDTEIELRNIIEELGLEEVVFLENLPHDPSAAFLSSDIYVSTSRWEGWSLAICEALRFGLPVIATDCEFGPGDILIDRRFGMLVPPADEEELAKAMLQYCDNLEDEKRHAEERMKYVDRFDIHNVLPIHADVLLNLAN